MEKLTVTLTLTLTLTLMLTLTPKFKLWNPERIRSNEKVVPWIETCKHYYQNESHQGESWTENHWHSRNKQYCYTTTTVPLEWQTQRFIRTASCEVVP